MKNLLMSKWREDYIVACTTRERSAEEKDCVHVTRELLGFA